MITGLFLVILASPALQAVSLPGAHASAENSIFYSKIHDDLLILAAGRGLCRDSEVRNAVTAVRGNQLGQQEQSGHAILYRCASPVRRHVG
jgi:hypothetical protein